MSELVSNDCKVGRVLTVGHVLGQALVERAVRILHYRVDGGDLALETSYAVLDVLDLLIHHVDLLTGRDL